MQGSVALHTVALLCPQPPIQQACVQSQRSSPITSDLHSSVYREIEEEKGIGFSRGGVQGSLSPAEDSSVLKTSLHFFFIFFLTS